MSLGSVACGGFALAVLLIGAVNLPSGEFAANSVLRVGDISVFDSDSWSNVGVSASAVARFGRDHSAKSSSDESNRAELSESCSLPAVTGFKLCSVRKWDKGMGPTSRDRDAPSQLVAKTSNGEQIRSTSTSDGKAAAYAERVSSDARFWSVLFCDQCISSTSEDCDNGWPTSDGKAAAYDERVSSNARFCSVLFCDQCISSASERCDEESEMFSEVWNDEFIVTAVE